MYLKLVNAQFFVMQTRLFFLTSNNLCLLNMLFYIFMLINVSDQMFFSKNVTIQKTKTSLKAKFSVPFQISRYFFSYIFMQCLFKPSIVKYKRKMKLLKWKMLTVVYKGIQVLGNNQNRKLSSFFLSRNIRELTDCRI